MRIGLFSHGWWRSACETLGHEIVDLPAARHSSGNAYSADVSGRTASGTNAADILAARPVDLLLDNGGTGLGFVRGVPSGTRLKPAHEAVATILCSHFVDPMVTAFQGFGWPEAWQCLLSRSWVKAIWDRAQALELARFGVPNVIHLPMAAPNRAYDVDPLNVENIRPIVSFVGGQNTSYFAAHSNVAPVSLIAGTLAQSIRSDLPQVSFYDAYHEVFGLGEPLKADDDIATQVAKTTAYWNAKLFFNASLCIRNRDRFVIFLKRKLGERFHLVGNGWEWAYGIAAAPPFPTAEAYFNHFREAAINLNLVNGNAETGLNMRHFEITAAGGFMLCYHQPELEEHFEIGRECDVFRNEQELLKKIQYYLGHADERASIAQAGQQRTLTHHLFSHRLQTLLDTVETQIREEAAGEQHEPAPPETSHDSATEPLDSRCRV